MRVWGRARASSTRDWTRGKGGCSLGCVWPRFGADWVRRVAAFAPSHGQRAPADRGQSQPRPPAPSESPPSIAPRLPSRLPALRLLNASPSLSLATHPAPSCPPRPPLPLLSTVASFRDARPPPMPPIDIIPATDGIDPNALRVLITGFGVSPLSYGELASKH